MSASGKSSNRHYEESRGYHSGDGHGVYAHAGDRQYRSEQNNAHRAGQPHNRGRCDVCQEGGGMTWRKAAEHTLRRRLGQIHRTIEDRTGLLFGRFKVTGYTTGGYPLDRCWLCIVPRADGYAFSVSVKGHGVYLDYVPRHEPAVEVSE